MEKDIALGNVGKLSLTFSSGKASVGVTASESVGNGAASVNVGATAVVDAGELVDLVFAAIEKASPAGAQPIEEIVKTQVKNAVLAIQ